MAALLIWVAGWLSREPKSATPQGAALLKTVQRAGGTPHRDWSCVATLLVLLVIRSLFYWQLGPAVNWTARLDLGIVAFPFRSDWFEPMLLYSMASFGKSLAVFYICLLLLSAVNRSEPPDNPWRQLVHSFLGPLTRLPGWAQLFIPLLGAVAGCALFGPALARAGFISDNPSASTYWIQGLTLGLASYLIWEYLIVAVLLLDLLNSYVYFGEIPFWQFVHSTARGLLQPLARIRLRWGPVDFAPFLAIAIVLAAGHFGAQGIAYLYRCSPF